jgi:hypothetical protein
VADITVSLDGFVTGPDPDLEHRLGRGGEPLHHWAFAGQGVVTTGPSGAASAASSAIWAGGKFVQAARGSRSWCT